MTHTAEGAADEFGEVETKETVAEDKTFEQEVNAVAATMVQNKEGIWELPEDSEVSDNVAYAAKIEKRRRDTQSALAKTSQELSATKDRSSKLESKLKESFVPQLTADQVDELDDLKSSDPEAYRQKMNEYEAAASKAFETELADAGYDADEVSEMADRATQLTEFLDNNPGLVLNDEVFEKDLPPRITGKLESGELSFEEFLVEAKGFLTNGTKVADTIEAKNEPDLGKTGGGSEANKSAIAGDSEASYKDEIY